MGSVVNSSPRFPVPTPDADLLLPREIGRARLPTNVLGLLVHTAEHAARHAGPVVTTMMVVQAWPIGAD